MKTLIGIIVIAALIAYIAYALNWLSKKSTTDEALKIRLSKKANELLEKGFIKSKYDFLAGAKALREMQENED
jgi:hypothetical protein